MVRKFITFISLVVILSGLIGCGLDKIRVQYGPDLRFQDELSYRKEGALIIEGTVKNYGNRPAHDVEILVKYYDSDNNIIKVDSTTINMLPLGPSQESFYKFQAKDPDNRNVKYKTFLNFK